MELCEKIKISNSMINQTNRSLGNIMNITNTTNIANNTMIKNKQSNKKEDEFGLGDMKNTIGDMMEEIQNKGVGVQPPKTHKGRKNLKNILRAEKEKISQVIENANYQANPLESMKYHIKSTQLIEEKRKKVQETYQKNYNFLNMN